MDNSDKTCATRNCCPVRGFILPSLAVFIVIFVFQYFWHGVLLKPMYLATASVWRPEAQMNHFCYIFLLRDLATAFIVTCLYCWVSKAKPLDSKKCPVSMGVRFGFKIGLLLGVTCLGMYVVLPIPKQLAIAWFLGDIAMGLLIGLVFCLCDDLKGNKDGA